MYRICGLVPKVRLSTEKFYLISSFPCKRQQTLLMMTEDYKTVRAVFVRSAVLSRASIVHIFTIFLYNLIMIKDSLLLFTLYSSSLIPPRPSLFLLIPRPSFLLVQHQKSFRIHKSPFNIDFGDKPTNQPTDGRTRPLIEMRGRI